MTNIVDDVSLLTSIPKKTLKQINDVYEKCIIEAIDEARKGNIDIVELDIGIGILTIKCEESSVRYKFTPSKEMLSNTAALMEGKLNSLEASLEKTTVDKIVNVYKGLL